MYSSPEEARSDLFLAGAVYVFGPLVLGIVLRLVPLLQVPVLGSVLLIVLPLVTTALVPLLLMRYRGESLRDYGFGGGPSPLLGTGALIAAPLAVATVLATLATGTDPVAALPAVAIGPGRLVFLLERLVSWLGLIVLAVYGTVKARDAFGGQWQTVRDGTVELGRYVGIALGVTTALLLLATLTRQPGGQTFALLLVPLGVVGAFFLALRTLTGNATTARTTLLTPVVLLALGPFNLNLFDAARFVSGVWLAAILAGVGLIVGALQESRRSAQGAVAIALVLALFTTLGGVGIVSA